MKHFPIDRLYMGQDYPAGPFRFDDRVAGVFDDMVHRSVPFYRELQELSCRILSNMGPQKGQIYDLGCSTGTSLLAMAATLEGRDIRFIGVDNSEAMLRRAQDKLSGYRNSSPIHLVCADLGHFDLRPADAVVAHFTLQFLPGEEKELVLKKVAKALKPGAPFLLSEKLSSPHPEVECALSAIHADFKSTQGYSRLEIARKREALENVLRPCSYTKWESLLAKAGFSHHELVFRWANFGTFLAIA